MDRTESVKKGWSMAALPPRLSGFFKDSGRMDSAPKVPFVDLAVEDSFVDVL